MFVSVALEEWAALQEDSRVLSALRAAGVDNWEGYDVAMQELAEEERVNDDD
jgi:hypothetical protein